MGGGGGEGEVVMAEERKVWECCCQGTVKRKGRQVGRGEVSAFVSFSFTLGGEERELASRLKVVPMAHAATLTHGCTLAVPGGPVT